MEKSKKKFNYLKFILAFAVLTAFAVLLPITAQAAQHTEGEKYSGGAMYYVNRAENEYWIVTNNEWHQCELYDGSENLDAVTDKVRSAMLNRDSGISFFFLTDNSALSENVDTSLPQDKFEEENEKLNNKHIGMIFDKIESDVYKKTSNPASGDYLREMVSFVNAGNSYRLTVSNNCKDYNFYYISISINCITTAHQEAQVKEFVEEWNEDYITSNKTISSSSGDEREYYIVKTIFNFITKNTYYFNDLYLDKNHTQYPVDGDIYKASHSAYGALFGYLEGAYEDDFTYKKTENGAASYIVDMRFTTDSQGLNRLNVMNQGLAVCDGYSALFYYMCQYNGIDCAIVQGDYDKSTGKESDPHAWNMVKLKDCYDKDYEWYAVDSTFSSQRTQKISNNFTIVNYEFFLRGTADKAFDISSHQKAEDRFSAVTSGWSVENYRFLVSNVDTSKLEVMVTRRRTADSGDLIVGDGKYNLENYLIIDGNNNIFKINEDKDGMIEAEDFTYYSTGYYYSVEVFDFAKGIEYTCKDQYLLDAGDYEFEIVGTTGGSSVSKTIHIAPLDMSKWENYDLSMSSINGSLIDGSGTGFKTEYRGAGLNISGNIYDTTKKLLKKNTDYKYYCYVKGDKNKTSVTPKNPANYIIRIEYSGNYCGEVEIPFTVEKAEIANLLKGKVSVCYGDDIKAYFSGFNITDNATGEVTKFENGVDYTVASVSGGQNYKDSGTVTVKALSGSKYFKAGTVSQYTYSVDKQRDLSKTFNGFVIQNEKYAYTGKEIKPTNFKLAYVKADGTRVELVLNKDYKITGYSNNINVSSAAKANVQFIGNYTGKATLTFTIVKTGSSAPAPKTFNVSKNTFTYNGKVQRPTVTVKDATGRQMVYKTDFTVSYSNYNSTNAGNYKMTVKFIGKYAGYASKTIDYKIKAKTTLPSISLSKGSFIYNGKAQKPSVTVKDGSQKLVYNTDYTVSYSNSSSKYVGKYTVTIKMKGNYSGSKTIGYFINPKGTEFLPSNKGGFKAISKGFTLKWNKQSTQTSGYQIQYSTRSDFKNAATVTIANPNTTSYTSKGRAAKTRYYVRIRTYKKVSGKTYYSAWNSGTKSVVTLK